MRIFVIHLKVMRMNKDEELPIVRKAENLTGIFFPQNEFLEKAESDRIEAAVKSGTIIKAENRGSRLYVDKKKLPAILGTDSKGVNKIYNNAQEKDKYENGNNKYLAQSEVKKEIEIRLEQPRNEFEREKLKHASNCLDAVRESETLKKERLIEAGRIEHNRSTLTQKYIKDNNITECELTGEKFKGDAEAHHVDRVSDAPEKALMEENLVAVKSSVHRDIHKKNAEGEEALKDYIEENGYNTPKALS